MFVLWLIFLPISVRIFQNDFNHENRHSGTCYIEKAVFVPRRFQSRFSAQWNTPLTNELADTLHARQHARWIKAKFHYASWFEAASKLVADQLRTSFESDSVMEFGFYDTRQDIKQCLSESCAQNEWTSNDTSSQWLQYCEITFTKSRTILLLSIGLFKLYVL